TNRFPGTEGSVMPCRLLRGGLVAAALVAPVALVSFASAKPPDLPANVEDVVAPEEAPPAGPPIVDQAGITVPSLWRPTPATGETEPTFYSLRLADRKLMTSCMLFGIHPLLALTPAEKVMYWPQEIQEALEETAAPQPVQAPPSCPYKAPAAHYPTDEP